MDNYRYLAGFVAWDQEVSPAARMILCDAQTSGGLRPGRQKTPDGYYNIERMLKSLVRRGEVAT